jgi:hypothetical protein
MAEMPIEPRLAKCLLASVSDAYCNTDVSQEATQSGSKSKSSGRAGEQGRGCSEELLSIAAMCSVDYPFIALKGRASDERKQQRLGAFSCYECIDYDPLYLALICSADLSSAPMSSALLHCSLLCSAVLCSAVLCCRLTVICSALL